MDKEFNLSGFDIYESLDGTWTVDDKNGNAHSGTFAQMVIYAVLSFGFDPDEIDLAVQEMVKQDHNAAHFGVRRSFIYTFERESNHERVAS